MKGMRKYKHSNILVHKKPIDNIKSKWNIK